MKEINVTVFIFDTDNFITTINIFASDLYIQTVYSRARKGAMWYRCFDALCGVTTCDIHITLPDRR